MNVSQIDRLYNSLVAYIKETPVRPGEALPAERKLADMFNSSRNTVREAIRMLQIRDYVEVRKGSGCYVKRAMDSGIIGDGCEVQFSCQETFQSLADQLEARLLLVPRLIRIALERMNGDYIERLEHTLVRLSQAILARDYPQIIEEDTRFHRIIAEATGNRMFMVLLRPLEFTSFTAREIFSVLSDNDVNEIFAGYVGILNALRKHDLNSIEKHVEKTMETMRGQLEVNISNAETNEIKEAI